jgi:filamentous hemagglutinin family protein
MYSYLYKGLLVGASLAVVSILPISAHAQVATPDPGVFLPNPGDTTDLGTVTTAGFNPALGSPENQVTGGTLSGNNLFHSFVDFSSTIPTRFFDGGADNIFVRVTGGNQSFINSTLAVDGGANLFFVNPSGVTFGTGARLDLSGSFLATTATDVFFGADSFNVNTPESDVQLLVNVPTGLQLGTNPINVTSGAQLITQADSALSLIGAGINVTDGELVSNGGQLNLISAANSQLSITGVGSGAPPITSTRTLNCGVSTCQNLAANDYRDITLDDATNVRVLAGDLEARGNNITLTSGSRLVTRPDGTQPGGTLSVVAQDTLRLTGVNLNNESGLFAENLSATDASPGNVRVQANQVLIQAGARITTSTDGVGAGGRVTVTAPSRVSIDGVSASGGDPSGIFSESLMNATGAGGPIEVNTRQLVISNGGTITSETSSPEPGGSIALNTQDLALQNQASVTVSAVGGSRAGDINVRATNIRQTNQGNIQATTASGLGGNMRFSVTENIVLRFNSEIVTEAQGSGDGGNIEFDVGGFILGILEENSDIVAGSQSGNGGRITGNASGIYTFNQFEGVRTALSDFRAASQTGLDGIVDIQTQTPPDQEPLVDDFASDDIAQGCRALAEAGPDAPPQSQFVIVNLGGLPAQPVDAGSSDLLLISPVSAIPETQNTTAVPDAPQTFEALAVLRLPCNNFEPS